MDPKQEKIIQKIEQKMKNQFGGESSGHDYWHLVRVKNLAQSIAKKESANLFIVTCAALLHDAIDEKLISDVAKAKRQLQEELLEVGLTAEEITWILQIMQEISFKGGHNSQTPSTLEAEIVQDADRLDAIGAIGIARTMSYSGFHHRLIHDPQKVPRETLTLEIYRNGQDTAIMHFYEKLLKLKDLMNTATAKQMAQHRHQYMEDFLTEFYAEWDGRC